MLKNLSYVLGAIAFLLTYAVNSEAVATFVIDTAPAIVDVTAAGIAMLAVAVVLFSFRKVIGIVK